MTHDFTPLVVSDAWDETRHTRALRLDFAALRASHRQPGQFVLLRIPGGIAEYFALSTAPGEPHAEVLLRRGGAIADQLIAETDAGDTIECTEALGPGFPLDRAQGRTLLLFASGSGIAPIRAVLRSDPNMFSGGPSRMILFYGQKEPQDFAYEKEWAAWRERHVALHFCMSRATHDREDFYRGYVQDVARDKLLWKLDPKTVTAFVSGSPEMIRATNELLTEFSIARDEILLNL